MKLLIDAQLPRRLAQALSAAGYDAKHTLDLPNGNGTPDSELASLAAQEGRVLVTKDADFVASFWLRRHPPKLLLISTGNISNQELLRLLNPQLARLEAAFLDHDFVEISRSCLTVHI